MRSGMNDVMMQMNMSGSQQQQQQTVADPYGTMRQQREYRSPSSPVDPTPPVTTPVANPPAIASPMTTTTITSTASPLPFVMPASKSSPPEDPEPSWFKPIDESPPGAAPTSTTMTHQHQPGRPYVDDSHRLRYQDIEDEAQSGNESGEETHLHHHHHHSHHPGKFRRPSADPWGGMEQSKTRTGTTGSSSSAGHHHHHHSKADEDSDDSLMEELATVAVKEGSDSDENLSDVEDLNQQTHKEETVVLMGLGAPSLAAEAVSSSLADDDGSGSSPPSEEPPILQVLDHNPGEVYPIAEEEEEAASPTAPDGVTSLRRRARLNSGWMGWPAFEFFFSFGFPSSRSLLVCGMSCRVSVVIFI